MSASAQRGHKIFNQKGKCFDCHFGPDFTGDEFRNIGLYNEKNLHDRGRATITGKEEDAGKFKVPGLRNVSKTAPYMHNGMFRTLREVIDYYDNPNKFVSDAINRDTLLARPLGLSERDKQDLEAFLRALDAQ
jgi:cytochrome c peroxidase